MNSSTSNSDQERGEPEHALRFPTAFGISIVVVIMIEWIALRADPPIDKSTIILPRDRVPTVVETIMEVKLEQAHTPGPPVEVLVIGDSSGLMGVDPRVCAKYLNQDVYNLCTVSLIGPRSQQAILERFLRAHGMPKRILYHYAPHELRHTEEEYSDWKLGEAAVRWLAAADGAPVPTQEGKSKPSLLVLPSQRFRTTAQSWLSLESNQQRNRKIPRAPYPSHDEMTSAINAQLGFWPEANMKFSVSNTELNLDTPESQLRSLDSLLAYCQSRDLPMILVASPLPESVRTKHTLSALRNQREKLQTIAEKYTDASVLFPQPRFYKDDDFATLNHLKPEAAVTNSAEIAEQLRQLDQRSESSKNR